MTDLPPPDPLTRGTALFLDLDGTLAPIAPLPSDVGPDPERNALLSRLDRFLEGRIAVVSGRPIADVDRILDRSVSAVAGIHGLERRSAFGEIHTTPPHPGLAATRDAFARLTDRKKGLIVEDKGSSIALHYRSVPRAEEQIHALGRHLAEATGLSLQEGKMVIELRTPGADKGDAIAAFMAEAPFAGARPVFAGDDITDEHGFALVEDAGGQGVFVGRSRETRASRGLADVDAVLAWLGAAV